MKKYSGAFLDFIRSLDAYGIPIQMKLNVSRNMEKVLDPLAIGTLSVKVTNANGKNHMKNMVVLNLKNANLE
jgi:hypothetical protein